MAQAPGHKFGQIIGDTLELSMQQVLRDVAAEHGLYLDCKHPRAARGGKRKVAWTDRRGNVHDLDYVLEAGGSETVIGKPRAFIESAWRRYTKHSRNKAQEIQGAIAPLAETYNDCHPFLGVILAGVFTEGSLTQLRSHGFHVLYYPYESIIAAFNSVGIDALFDEGTEDSVLQTRIDAYEALSPTKKETIAATLRSLQPNDLDEFLAALRRTLGRSIRSVYIVPLHGAGAELDSVDQAITFLKHYEETIMECPFVCYELFVRYTNGDEVRGDFRDKASAIKFLNALT